MLRELIRRELWNLDALIEAIEFVDEDLSCHFENLLLGSLRQSSLETEPADANPAHSDRKAVPSIPPQTQGLPALPGLDFLPTALQFPPALQLFYTISLGSFQEMVESVGKNSVLPPSHCAHLSGEEK